MLLASTVFVDGLDHLYGYIKDQGKPKVSATTDDPSADSTPVPLTPGGKIKTREKPLKVHDDVRPDHFQPSLGLKVALGVIGLVLGAGVGSILLRFRDFASNAWSGMATGEKVTLFLGVLTGVIVTLPFLFLFQGFDEITGRVMTVAFMVGFSALSVYALRSMEDALPWQKMAGARRRTGLKVLDTNVLIDGRVYDLIRSGFLDGEIYVPSFVLLELQHIADSADSLRRQRGRRGLEVLRRLQSEFPIEVGTHDKHAGSAKDEVDTRLVNVAKALGGDLVSNDFNLNRVATIQSVRVLNINDLALALRPTVLPGEPLDVMIIKEGSQVLQGVGYLDDGTMVVVEGGLKYLGEIVTTEVTQVIQTERGKMIFAEAGPPVDEPEEGNGKRKPRR